MYPHVPYRTEILAAKAKPCGPVGGLFWPPAQPEAHWR